MLLDELTFCIQVKWTFNMHIVKFPFDLANPSDKKTAHPATLLRWDVGRLLLFIINGRSLTLVGYRFICFYAGTNVPSFFGVVVMLSRKY